jgi:predicted thioesterase
VAEKDEFFLPEDVDRQIERVSQFKEGDRTDAEALAYLRSFYQADAQQEQETLNRIWNRITGARLFEYNEQESENKIYMQDRQTQNNRVGPLRPQGPQRPRRAALVQRLGLLAAAVFLIALVGSLAIVFYAVRHNNGGTATPHPTATVSTARVPLKVTAVDMSVTPGSIAGISCGTNVTVTYTAVFHVVPNSVGGTVKFTYTVNNGRGQTPASIHFDPGETTKSYTFTWSGALPLDHTYPEAGGVQVTSPNALTSSLVAPTGQCTSANFQVTKIDMAVSPTSIQGMACGTSIVVTYTATIHVAPNSPGGTVKFNYTVNNGRGQTPASINFGQGETSKTYTFTWSGALPADHTYPGPGGIQVTSPNALTSPLVAPTGQCTSAAPFQVTQVTMSVSPTSIQGLACGTSIVVTYTATIHVAANGPGGTVQFTYTVNNGRGQTPASITFSPGQTVRTYTFTWSGALPADHTYPGPGGIQVTSPNQLTSPLVAPTGRCS